MKISIDVKKCDGHAKCVEAAPKVFKMNERYISEVIDPQGDTDEKIVLAARICPTKAIIVEDDSGNRVFPPEGS